MDSEVDVMILDGHVTKLLESGVVCVWSGCTVTI